MEDYWTTIKGEEIKFCDLEDKHLLNILKFLEKKSKQGFLYQIGGGFDMDDMWYDSYMVYGNDYLKLTPYYKLKNIAKKRKLIFK